MRSEDEETRAVNFRMHPRVFAALGADLVTSDTVAVMELVKNSYDAFATRVDIRFVADSDDRFLLEVEDNGCGMDRDCLENVWAVVGTPFRLLNPRSVKGKNVRRVSGSKGLGRLSSARLGRKLEMLTKSEGGPCWHLTVDWTSLASASEMGQCCAYLRRENKDRHFAKSGTLLQILDLTSQWDDDTITELQESLARLVTPFSKVDDFRLFFTVPRGDGKPEEVEIAAPEFLSKPKYAIRGHVDSQGTVHSRYEYSPLSDGSPRSVNLTLSRSQIAKAVAPLARYNRSSPDCGPFEFEVRAWDVGPDDTLEIAEHFGEAKANIRRAIRAHKGISVYRDGILVLPKSEDARDWLGLDLRRISKVGTRLSTSQIVGFVSISADQNKDIEDTSDRENLAKTPAVAAFQEILKAIVSQLEDLRDEDRVRPGGQAHMSELFEDLSAETLVAEMTAIADEGALVSEALPMLKQFREKLDSTRGAIERRFIYYSRLATVGTIAQMLVHEIRNRTTVLGQFIRRVARRVESSPDDELGRKVDQAQDSVATLERLADTFAPLASRGFRRRRRDGVLELSIQRCLEMVDKDIKDLSITVSTPKSEETRVAVDPGELDAVFLNLINNAVYWLAQKKKGRRLAFTVSRPRSGRRVEVTVDDSGPGVSKEDIERIFLPGVTRKPGGIGMGLTVASEIIGEYGGKMGLIYPGVLGGASFSFDIPAKV